MRLRATRLCSLRSGVMGITAIPANINPPTISGIGYVGTTYTASAGTWSGSPILTYQWQRNGSNIGGATSITYVATIADEGAEIRVVETATNMFGSASVNSAAIHRWIPTDLGAALRIWLDAKDSSTITIATGVSSWADKSGNVNNFTQGNTSFQPSYASNRVTLDGIDDYLVGIQELSVEHAVFIAGQNRTTNTDINASIWSQDGGSNPDFWITYRSSNATNIQSLNTLAATSASPSVGAPFATDMVTAYQKPSMAGISITSINGVQSTLAAAAVNGAQLGTRLVLGSQKLSVSRFAGADIMETFIVNTRLSTDNFQRSEGYLAWRNGTISSLDASHPYKSSPPSI